jgi:hypothetical protein
MKPPVGTSCGGTVVIIIIKSIKHHELNNYSQNFLQTTNVAVENSVGLLTISAVCLHPNTQ